MVVLLAVALTPISVAGPAVALPGDAPVAPIAPASGATVGTDPQGIQITYACPRYGDYVDSLTGVVVTAGSEGYRAAVSTSPAVDSVGLLAEQVKTTSGPTGDPGTCSSRLGSSTDTQDLRPQRVPGAYYWQVWRLCSDCVNGVEVGPVRAFTVAASTALTVVAPKAVYAAIPTLVPVRVTDDLGTPVVLQRRTSKGWKSLGHTDVGRQGELPADQRAIIVRLPRGKQRVRAVTGVGGQEVTSKTVRIKVRKAAGWSPGAAAVGGYRDRDHRSLRFAVVQRGRTVKGFTTEVTATCLSPGGQTSFASRILTLPKVRIAPDGYFVTLLSRAGQRSWLQGRLKRGKVTGYASYQGGACSGDLRFAATKR